jgi:hypothetical protein
MAAFRTCLFHVDKLNYIGSKNKIEQNEQKTRKAYKLSFELELLVLPDSFEVELNCRCKDPPTDFFPLLSALLNVLRP